MGVLKAGGVVLSAASTGIWIVSVATSDDHQGFNFWAVVALAFIAATAIVYAVDQRRAARSVPPIHHHHVVSSPTAHANARRAVHDILDETHSMELRVARARREGRCPFGFNLPRAHEFHDHKDALPSGLRRRMGDLYVKADDLTNQVLARPDENGYEIRREDDLAAFLRDIRRARRALRWYRWRHRL